MKIKTVALWLCALSVYIAVPEHASAYIGPGAGLSAIGTIAALAATVLLLIAGFVWYPVKRLLRRRGGKAQPGGEETTVAKE